MTATTAAAPRYFVREAEIAGYHPANHTGTLNKRLIGPETVGAKQLEVLVGHIQKGKGALPHAHPGIEQVCYMLEGLAVAIPTLLIAGPFFSMSLGRIVARPPEMFRPAALDEADLPGGFASIGIALLPVLLIALMTAIGYLPGLPAGAKP